MSRGGEGSGRTAGLFPHHGISDLLSVYFLSIFLSCRLIIYLFIQRDYLFVISSF
jgi:hypothetical protein